MRSETITCNVSYFVFMNSPSLKCFHFMFFCYVLLSIRTLRLAHLCRLAFLVTQIWTIFFNWLLLKRSVLRAYKSFCCILYFLFLQFGTDVRKAAKEITTVSGIGMCTALNPTLMRTMLLSNILTTFDWCFSLC